MERTQIANLLNTEFVPNVLGLETTVAEDLSNVVDIGKHIADLDADDLKDAMKKFALGVAKTVFMTQKYTASDLGIFRSAEDYAGALQVVMMSVSDFVASDDPSYDLENGANYFDGTYYGVNPDTVLYLKEIGTQIKHSIANQMYKRQFTDGNIISSYVSALEQTLQNKIDLMKHALAKGLICKVIESVYADRSGARVYHLITEYNTEFGYQSTDANYITKANHKAHPEFLRWCSMQIARLTDNMQEISKKYNDATIENFTTRENMRIALLSEFDKSVDYVMQSDTYNKDITSLPNHYSVGYWQNSSNKLVDNYGATAEVYEKNSTKRTNVVGVIYSYYTCGLTLLHEGTTMQYIANGDYNTFFHKLLQKYFVDKRNNAVVLALD